MHETQEIVINTGPILALIPGLGDLRVLQMYERVLVPWEVSQEILVENGSRSTDYMLRDPWASC